MTAAHLKLTMDKLLLIALLGFGTAGAQSLSVGLLGGAPFNDVVNGDKINGIQSIAKSTNFTIGGAVQVNLPLSLRLEVDGLFRPYHFTINSLNIAEDITAQQY